MALGLPTGGATRTSCVCVCVCVNNNSSITKVRYVTWGGDGPGPRGARIGQRPAARQPRGPFNVFRHGLIKIKLDLLKVKLTKHTHTQLSLFTAISATYHLRWAPGDADPCFPRTLSCDWVRVGSEPSGGVRPMQDLSAGRLAIEELLAFSLKVASRSDRARCLSPSSCTSIQASIHAEARRRAHLHSPHSGHSVVLCSWCPVTWSCMPWTRNAMGDARGILIGSLGQKCAPYIYIYMYTYTFVCVYTYIYIYIYTHIQYI